MQHIVADKDIGPDTRHELLTRHHLAGSFGERFEHLHHLRLEPDFLRPALQAIERRMHLPLANIKRLHTDSIEKSSSPDSSQPQGIPNETVNLG